MRPHENTAARVFAAWPSECILTDMAARVRVMIADDHPLVRSGLRLLLEREGEFQVIAEAANGYEAIDLAALHKPDVILLDVGMPRLNGPDAAHAAFRRKCLRRAS